MSMPSWLSGLTKMEDEDHDLVPDMPLPNLSSQEGGDRVVRRVPLASRQTTNTSSRSQSIQSFSDIPEHPQQVYPRILESLEDQPGQDPGLQCAEDNSDELQAQLMEASAGSGSASTNSSVKGMLPTGPVHPSRGSEKHSSGNCQPCSFFLRGKCTVAEGCLYCHYEHDRPQRPGKKSRERAKRRQEASKSQEQPDEAPQQHREQGGHGFGSFHSLARHLDNNAFGWQVLANRSGAKEEAKASREPGYVQVPSVVPSAPQVPLTQPPLASAEPGFRQAPPVPSLSTQWYSEELGRSSGIIRL